MLEKEDILPPKVFPVALYLVSVMQSASSPSPVLSAFYSLKWFHDIHGLQSPTDSKLLINLVESAKRKLSKHVIKKEPITVDILQSIYKSLFIERHVKN